MSFTASGIGPLLAIAALTLLPARSERLPPEPFVLDFMPVLRDHALMAYVLAFAGNIWGVSAVRAWFVAYLAWTLSLPGKGAVTGLSNAATLAVEGQEIHLARSDPKVEYTVPRPGVSRRPEIQRRIKPFWCCRPAVRRSAASRPLPIFDGLWRQDHRAGRASAAVRTFDPGPLRG